jgi:hypothetical protein
MKSETEMLDISDAEDRVSVCFRLNIIRVIQRAE